MNRNKIIKIIMKQFPSWINAADDNITVETDAFIEKYTFDSGTEPIKLFFTMIGPEGTLWAGKQYKGYILYGLNYPMSPPDIFFTSNLLHPNVYVRSDIKGKLCISILHEGTDITGYEDEYMQWTPAHNINTILRSSYSLFFDPACDSPANVDISRLYLRDKEALAALINNN